MLAEIGRTTATRRAPPAVAIVRVVRLPIRSSSRPPRLTPAPTLRPSTASSVSPILIAPSMSAGPSAITSRMTRPRPASCAVRSKRSPRSPMRGEGTDPKPSAGRLTPK